MAKAEVAAIESRCGKIAEGMGFELVDIAVEKEPTGRYLRFYIDKPEGISLDDCEAYHKAVRDIADAVDYDFMEVSSPGIDRPLKKDRDFERNLGSRIEIRLFRPVDGTKVLTGILDFAQKCGNPFDLPIAWRILDEERDGLSSP